MSTLSQHWHTALTPGPVWEQHPAWASAPPLAPGPRQHTPLPARAGLEQRSLRHGAGMLLLLLLLLRGQDVTSARAPCAQLGQLLAVTE